jgi:hypothetical protein
MEGEGGRACRKGSAELNSEVGKGWRQRWITKATGSRKKTRSKLIRKIPKQRRFEAFPEQQ